MKMIKYEILKIIKNKTLIFLFIILFGVNCLVSVIPYFNYISMEDHIYQKYSAYVSEIEKTGKDEAVLENDGTLSEDEFRSVIARINEEMSYCETIGKRINEIIENGKKLKGISIFASSASSAKNIEKSVADYLTIKDVKAVFGNYVGITNFIMSEYTMFFVIILAGYCVYLIFSKEKENSLNDLIFSTGASRLKIVFCKLLSLLTVSVVLFSLFFASDWIILGLKYGYQNIMNPVQSFSAFSSLVYPFSFFQTAIAATLVKLGFVLFFASLLCLAATVVGSFSIAILFSCLFMVIEIALYYFIPMGSGIDFLKYVNAWHFLNFKSSLFTYRNVFFFKGLFSNSELLIMAIAWFIVLSVLLVIVLFVLDVRAEKKQFVLHFGLISKIKEKSADAMSLPLFEMIQLLLHNKVIIVLIVYVSYFMFSGYHYQIYSSEERRMYNHYVQKYSGLISEKYSEYQSEYDYINAELKKIEEYKVQYENGQLDSQVYHEAAANKAELELKRVALNRLSSQIDLNHYENPYILDEKPWKYLFQIGLPEGFNTQSIDTLILIIAVILIASPVAANQNTIRMGELYQTTVNYKKMILTKYKTVIGLSWILYLVFLMKHIGYAVNSYCLTGFNAASGNISFFLNTFIEDQPIGAVLIFCILLKLIIVSSIAVLSVIISEKLQSFSMGILTSSLLFVIPSMVTLYLGNQSKFFSILSILYGTNILRIEKFGILVLYEALIILFFRKEKKRR